MALFLFRFDMAKGEEYYTTNMKWHVQPLADIKQCAWKQQLSCNHQPLLNIQPSNIFLDELHVTRVTCVHIPPISQVKTKAL